MPNNGQAHMPTEVKFSELFCCRFPVTHDKFGVWFVLYGSTHNVEIVAVLHAWRCSAHEVRLRVFDVVQVILYLM